MQLVFCLACLSMSAWTWMRYSYVWELSAQDVWVPGTHFIWPDRAYVRLPAAQAHRALKYFADRGIYFYLYEGATGKDEWVFSSDEMLHKLLPQHGGAEIRGRIVFFGRETGWHEYSGPYVSQVGIDPSSWLHPASASGLVVGAMGCFIFGLYLRRWLGERKALAGEPQRDMIA
jgi:hypothetical protein